MVVELLHVLLEVFSEGEERLLNLALQLKSERPKLSPNGLIKRTELLKILETAII